MPSTTCKIEQDHCSQCGNTDNEDILFRSYSGCCNEPVVMVGVSRCSGDHN